MSDEKSELRIVQLPPMRVASFHGFGTQPENEAIDKLNAWAKPKGYVGEKLTRRVFGFNNPDPSPGSMNYGYEFWIELEPDEEVESDVRVLDFEGGAYAVERCEVVGDAYEAIPNGWQQLHAQCEKAGLRMGKHQWLEEHLSLPESGDVLTLDLMMPIVV